MEKSFFSQFVKGKTLSVKTSKKSNSFGGDGGGGGLGTEVKCSVWMHDSNNIRKAINAKGVDGDLCAFELLPVNFSNGHSLQVVGIAQVKDLSPELSPLEKVSRFSQPSSRTPPDLKTAILGCNQVCL